MNPPRKILVIRFSSIGDIVQTTSPLKTLHLAFPQARIDFLTLTTFAALLDYQRDVDQVICVEPDAGIRALKTIGKVLSREGYDLLVDLHGSLRSILIRRQMAAIPMCVLKKPRWRRFLLYQFHMNRFQDSFSYRQLLHSSIEEVVSIPDSLPDTNLCVTQAEKVQTRERLKSLGVGEDYLVCVPGAAWSQKLWPEFYYRQVLEELRDSRGLSVVLLGGIRDILCKWIAKDQEGIVDLHGKTDLREALAILSMARTVIGSDTGLVHAAEALGVNVLMICGPTSRVTGAGASRPGSITVENSKLWCRPCSQNGSRPCYQDEPRCLTEIDPQDVFIKLESMVA